MRKEVEGLAQGIADEQLERLEWITISEIAEGWDIELTDSEYEEVYNAVTCARTTLDPVVAERFQRLSNVVIDLAAHAGIDLASLVEDGYLEEGDLG